MLLVFSGFCIQYPSFSWPWALQLFPPMNVFHFGPFLISMEQFPTMVTPGERVDHRMDQMVVPCWLALDGSHSLCPVAACGAMWLVCSQTTFWFPGVGLDTFSSGSILHVSLMWWSVLNAPYPGWLLRGLGTFSGAAFLAILQSFLWERVRSWVHWLVAQTWGSGTGSCLLWSLRLLS